MNSPPTVDVKVIFDASSRRGRGPARVAPRTRTAGATGWRIVGCTHLLVAAALYFITWWRVDPFIYMTLMLKTPVDVDMAAGIFIPSQRSAPDRAAQRGPGPSETRTAQTTIGAASYGWLAVSTLAACTLALAGGAGLGRNRGALWRRYAIRIVIVGACALVLGVVVVVLWKGRLYTPGQLRVGMGVLLFLAASIGSLLGTRVRGLSQAASMTLILAGIGTVVAVYLGAKFEALEPQYATARFAGLAFLLHSAYGWLTLPLMRFIR